MKIKNLKLIIALNGMLSFSAGYAQGFIDSSKNTVLETREEKLKNWIGKTFTLMPNPAANPKLKCTREMGFKFLSTPSLFDNNIYESTSPIEYHIEGFAKSADQYASRSDRYLKIIINDSKKTTAYARDFAFYATTFNSKNSTALRGCNFEGDAKTVTERIDAASKSVKTIQTGMTYETVINQTDWGEPDKVNTTQTANGTQSQWVYSNFWKKGFLYFNAQGILTAIQEQ